MLEDEIVHPLKGGTLLDMNHDELPSTIVKGVEGLEPRLNQGELRKFMNKHHENDKDALKRRKRVAALAPLARDQGLIPGVDKIDLEGNITTLLTGEVDKPNGVEMSREGGRGRGVGKGVHTVGEGSGAQLGYSSHSAIDTLSAYSIVPNEVEEEDRGFGSGSGTKKSKLSTEEEMARRTDFSTVETLPSRLSWPQAFIGQPVQEDLSHLNEVGSGGSQFSKSPGKKGPVIGTLHDYAPDGSPTSYDAMRKAGLIQNNGTNNYPMDNNQRGGGMNNGIQSQQQLSQSGNGNFMNANVISSISQSLGLALSNLNLQNTNTTPQDMIQIGLGLGMALVQNGAFQNQNSSNNNGTNSLMNSTSNGGNMNMNRGGEFDDNNQSKSMFPILSEDAYQQAYETNIVNAEKPRRPVFNNSGGGASNSPKAMVKFEEPIGKDRTVLINRLYSLSCVALV